MRICCVSSEYSPISVYSGGIGVLYAALLPALAQSGHDVHLICFGGDAARSVELDGVHIALRPKLENTPRELVRRARLVDAAIEAGGPFDVVLAPEWGGEAASFAARGDRPPLATHLHTSLRQVLDLTPDRRRIGRARPRLVVQRALERWQARRSDAFIASSWAIRRWTIDDWSIDPERTSVLPNPVDAERIVRLAAGGPAAPADDRDPVVAFVGRLEARKGVQVLARAMLEVWRRVPKARLVLFGGDVGWSGGSMEDHLRDIAGEHAGLVEARGRLPPERLFPELARADVVALPSLWENYPSAALEAMALGRAVVCTSGSGFDDFCVDGVNALLVPPGEPEPLAAALVRVLADEGLRAELGRGAKDVAAAHAPPVVAARYTEELARIVDRHGRTG